MTIEARPGARDIGSSGRQVRELTTPVDQVIDTVIPDGNDPHMGKLLEAVTMMQHSGRERAEADLLAGPSHM